jgi:hypothetical protein
MSRELALFKPNSSRHGGLVFCCVFMFSTRVAARLLHTECPRQNSSATFWFVVILLQIHGQTRKDIGRQNLSFIRDLKLLKGQGGTRRGTRLRSDSGERPITAASLRRFQGTLRREPPRRPHLRYDALTFNTPHTPSIEIGAGRRVYISRRSVRSCQAPSSRLLWRACMLII